MDMGSNMEKLWLNKKMIQEQEEEGENVEPITYGFALGKKQFLTPSFRRKHELKIRRPIIGSCLPLILSQVYPFQIRRVEVRFSDLSPVVAILSLGHLQAPFLAYIVNMAIASLVLCAELILAVRKEKRRRRHVIEMRTLEKKPAIKARRERGNLESNRRKFKLKF